MTALIIFDDDLGRLGPMTTLRPACAVRTGALTTAERIERLYGKAAASWWVAEDHAAIAGEHGTRPVDHLPDDDSVLCVNGRLRGTAGAVTPPPGEVVADASGAVVAAHLDAAAARTFLETGAVPQGATRSTLDDSRLVTFPWDVLDELPGALAGDLAAMTGSWSVDLDATVVGDPSRTLVHDGATIGAGVVIDVTGGPVHLAEGATIGHGAILCGPCAVLAGATVLPQALIKANTVIGPVCKVAG